MNEVTRFLEEHGAANDLLEFGSQCRSLIRLWDTCPRVDWLLWMLEALQFTNRRELRLLACWQARQFWNIMPGGACRRAVEQAEAFAREEITKTELTTAQFAAVKAARDLSIKDNAGARVAWVACATTLQPSLDAARHALQRSAALLREPAIACAAGNPSPLEAHEKLRDLFGNPFTFTRADMDPRQRSSQIRWTG